MGYIKTSENDLDLMTKTVPSGQDRKKKLRKIMYAIYPEYNVGSF